MRKTRDGPPLFSWRMPNAVFGGKHSSEMKRFLRGTSQTHKFFGFNGNDDAHNWVNQIRYQDVEGFSANAIEGRRGSDAFVTVTKTTKEYNLIVGEYTKDKRELIELDRMFGHEYESYDDASEISQVETDHESPSVSSRESNEIYQADQIDAFLSGKEESCTFHHFNNAREAEFWASRHFRCDEGYVYSASATSGEGSDTAHVTITKLKLDYASCLQSKRQRKS